MVNVEGSVVEFRFFSPGSREVRLAGEFNGWSHQKQPMRKGPDGYWTARLTLPPGSYRFRYWADGAWYTDFAAFGLEAGPFGLDSVVRVAPGVAGAPAAEDWQSRSKASVA